ncbi:D-alanine--D-alanine ligase family protein [Tissierella sp. Yu-01]|uniref:D-alanine--D-alanine ligase family protein n=1 Tax=Tissierella sp. Yu-01 TaxID=3035694 RepID=UPI00240D8AAC|nr:D-alanine--D-alanine ligase family protein [Tissierella sp. Yu-01]WFA10195.1 D-alanine--D-alanine ligase [Tissierella sp. Yu-01]
MIKVGVIFGGQSVEHEVSVITGMQVIENIDKAKYEAVPIYITKEGKWLTGPSLADFKTYKEGNFKDTKEIIISPNRNDYNIYLHPEATGLFGKKIIDRLDVIFPALHGTYGEDGSIQGLFELMNIPYVGGGVLGSSVGMDKILMKDVYRAYNIPVVDYTWFYRTDWEVNKDKVIADIEEKLGYPTFVKPANLGSSIGISKAKDKEGLIKAIEIAVNYDRKIIIEKAVESPREINCAVMGYDNEVITSLCEEPLGWKEILSFEDKYVKSNAKGGKSSGERRIIPADISDEIRIQIEELAKKAFTVIDGKGTSRIDFLVDENNKVYVNEINTLPGSIGFYLWEGKGYPFGKLVSELIEIALKTHKEKNKNMYTYEANLFNRIQYGSKIK